jgi:carboxymethylenebutenolidase
VARSLGGKAVIVTYPGKEHGFDFSDTDPMTPDAIRREVQFFRGELLS